MADWSGQSSSISKDTPAGGGWIGRSEFPGPTFAREVATPDRPCVTFSGVPLRNNPRYTLLSHHALERLHFASPGVLDRGTRLSSPVPFRSAFARARQSLWQRLIILASCCSANRFWLFALSC